MRHSRHLVSLKTFGLAFAIALSPALMQTESLTCAKTGDPTLSTLEVEVSGRNHITTFDPEDLSYDVWLPLLEDSATVRAYSTDPGSQVMYNYSSAGTGVIDYGSLALGGDEFPLDGLLPEGTSRLLVSAKAPGGATKSYVVNIHVGCSDCDDGLVCTADTCDIGPQVCVHDLAPGVGGECVFPCTEQGIKDAILVGEGPHTFACSGPRTVVTQAEIVIDRDVILDGEGNLTVDGDDDHTVFRVSSYVTAELRGMTMTKGNALVGEGSCIHAELDADLTLVDSTVLAGSWGGSRCIASRGTLSIIDSVVMDPRNDPINSFNGILNYGQTTVTNSTVSGFEGALVLWNGPTSITNSRVSGNTGGWCGRCGGGVGVITTSGTTTINGSSIVDNGTIAFLNYGTLTMTNSTVSGNGPDLVYNDDSEAVFTVSNTTFSGNESLFLWNSTIRNSVVDGDCSAVGINPTSNGYNIESPGDTCGFDQASDQPGVTAEQLNLGPLADNGGPTMTHALLPGSVAIDWIPEEDCVDGDGQPLTTDQRGVTRPQGLNCDVGAFELEQ